MSDEPLRIKGEDGGEVYLDVVKGEVRKRTGPRKHRRGPYSGAEKKMRLAFNRMIASMHWMDGELADMTATYFAAQFAAVCTVTDRYSFDAMPNPGPEDWDALRDELGITGDADGSYGGDVDVWDALGLCLLARAIRGEKYNCMSARAVCVKMHVKLNRELELDIWNSNSNSRTR